MTVETTKTNYSDHDLEYVTILIDDSGGQAPDLKDVQLWASTFNLSAPVLQGNRDLNDGNAQTGYPLAAWPTFVFINKEMVVHGGMYGFNEHAIHQLIEEML